MHGSFAIKMKGLRRWVVCSLVFVLCSVALFLGSCTHKDQDKDQNPYELSWQSNALYITMPKPSCNFNDIIRGPKEYRQWEHSEQLWLYGSGADWGKVDPTKLSEDIYETLKKSGRSGDVHIYAIFTYKETDKYGNVSTIRMPARYVVTIQMSEVSKFVSQYYFDKNYKILHKIVCATFGDK